MSKNTIKKIILTIIILSVLILSLIFFYRITSENHKGDISIIKKIISEKYEDIKYFDNSYLYAYNKREYTVFDYNGNRLYSFDNIEKDNIVTVSKKYYLTHDSEYHLFNNNREEIVSSKNINPINDYLIYVDNNIINTKGEVLFYDVKNITPCYRNKYFLVDNYFIDEKGKVLLYGYKIIKEKINDNEIDYIIVKKDKKYYCFFPLVNNIIGDGFEKYFEYDDKIYIVSDNKIYAISMNGLRQEIIFTIDKNIDENKLDFSNAVRKNRILTIRDYYLGILETDTNKFHKITKTKKYSYKYIDKDHINIYCNNRNYVYDLNNYKIEYTNVFDKIIMFSNGYKTIRNNSKYYLLDKDDKIIAQSDKQIIILNSKVKMGKVNEDIVIYDNALYPGKSVTINKKTYYKFNDNNKMYIISKDLKEKYESIIYLNNMDNTIVKMDNGKLYFYNKINNKTYTYDLKDYRVINSDINKNEIVLSNDKNIIVLNSKGKVIKKIKNVRLENIYFNKTKQSIIVVVIKDRIIAKTKGAYVLK